MGLEEKEDKKKWMKRKGRRREWSRVRNGLEEDKKEKRVERKGRGRMSCQQEGVEVEGATVDKDSLWTAWRGRMMRRRNG